MPVGAQYKTAAGTVCRKRTFEDWDRVLNRRRPTDPLTVYATPHPPLCQFNRNRQPC